MHAPCGRSAGAVPRCKAQLGRRRMANVLCSARILTALVAMAVSGFSWSADNYPARPIRVVTAEPGSGNDLMVRLIAHDMSAGLGQPVIVDDRGMVSMQMVAKGRGDGYTLL